MDGSSFAPAKRPTSIPDAFVKYQRLVSWARRRYIRTGAFAALNSGRACAVRAYNRIEEAAFAKYVV